MPCSAAKERALADQQEALLAARTEADRKLDALNQRLRGVAERERELEARQAQLTAQVRAGVWRAGGAWGGRCRGRGPAQHTAA